MCVCVCVCFGSMNAMFFLLRDVFESLTCWLDLYLSSLLVCIHLFVFFLSLKNSFISSSTDSRQIFDRLKYLSWMYREEAQKPQWIKNLSKIYRPGRKFLDGSKKLSRSYRDTVQKARWIEYAIRSIKKRRKKGSIDAKLSSLIKRSFSKRGKTQRDECKQASYSNIDPINMLSSQKKNHSVGFLLCRFFPIHKQITVLI